MKKNYVVTQSRLFTAHRHVFYVLFFYYNQWLTYLMYHIHNASK
jgi:hypothetical protein